MIIDAFKQQAPDLPGLAASYQPIYFEPMMGSGERFTIGIMAYTETGESGVVQTLSDKTMQCMYGDKADQVRGLVLLVLESAKVHLKAGYSLDQWQPPISGAIAGMPQKTYSSNGLDGVFFQAITSYASLYKGKIVKDALSELNNNGSSEEDEVGQMTAGLIQQVKAILLNTSTEYQSRWQRVVLIKQNAIISIDYLGAKYNANLSNFDVKGIKPAFNAAKTKLFDLEVLREKRQQEVFNTQQSFELLIGLKNNAPSEAEDCFKTLEQLADSIGLRVVKKSTPLEMADRIIKQEQAA